MTREEIIKQHIAIGISLYIGEIDYNKAWKLTEETIKEYDNLVKNIKVMQCCVNKDGKEAQDLDIAKTRKEAFNIEVEQLTFDCEWCEDTGVMITGMDCTCDKAPSKS